MNSLRMRSGKAHVATNATMVAMGATVTPMIGEGAFVVVGGGATFVKTLAVNDEVMAYKNIPSMMVRVMYMIRRLQIERSVNGPTGTISARSARSASRSAF